MSRRSSDVAGKDGKTLSTVDIVCSFTPAPADARASNRIATPLARHIVVEDLPEIWPVPSAACTDDRR